MAKAVFIDTFWFAEFAHAIAFRKDDFVIMTIAIANPGTRQSGRPWPRSRRSL